MWLWIFCGVLAGVGLSFQTASNARLRLAVGSPYLSSMISFLIGTLILGVVVVFNGSDLSALASEMPWWMWFGGVCGVIGLTTNILLFPQLGAVQTVVIPVIGSVVQGVLIDSFGWLNAEVMPFHLTRLLGVIFALLGMYFAVMLADKIRNRNAFVVQSKTVWAWRIFGFIGGMIGVNQTAINGQFGKALNSPLTAAFISMAIGTLTLFVVVLIRERKFKRIITVAKSGLPLWAWFGGVFGGLFVTTNALLAPRLGTGQTVLLTLLGMIFGSVLSDQFGWFGTAKKPILGVQVLGLVLLFAGVAIIRLL